MRRILIAIFSLAFATTGNAQWANTPNVTGKTLIFHNNRLIAGGTTGAYVSDDNGATFTLSNNGLPGSALSNFFPRAIAGNSIFAMSDRVYKSTDNGNTWALASTGLQASSIISYIYFDGTTLYTTFQDGKVYTSTDDGSTWTLKGNVGTYIVMIKSYNGVLFAGTSTLGMYTSTDGGASWNAANTGISAGDKQVYAMANHYNDLFIGSYSGKIYKWNTTGNSWDLVHNAGSAIRAFHANGNAIMVATDGGFTYSTDNGATWQVNNIGLSGSSLYFFDLATSDQYIFSGLFNGGVLRHSLSDLGIVTTGVTATNAVNMAVNIFPNPAYEMVQVESKEVSLKNYDICNVTGQKMTSGTLISSNSIDISTLPAGYYFIKLFTNKGTVVKSIIKQ